MTRPSYQAGSVARMVLATVALWTKSQDWHESSSKAVNAFLYTRLLIKYIGPLMKTKEGDVPSQQGIYNFAVIVGAILSLGEGPIPYIPFIYVFLVIINAALNRETTVIVDQILAAEEKTVIQEGSISGFLGGGPALETTIVQTVVATGFVERGVIPKVEAHVAPIPGDEYVHEKDHAVPIVVKAEVEVDVAQ
ncbi:hypothetical protein FKW77_009405 [Venturia effusa]|uniref:Uncharacterized protein n=1 Tax=Venturia effusa TaxID=50376 RepID=A0A517L837_9PEZI|nr:hypothetical protein FKW77_009405 [Venturia effusa]